MTRTISIPQASLRFGIGRRDITPPIGIYSRWWGAATSDQSTGVHRPLALTAVFIGAADVAVSDAQVVVAMDLCIVGWREQQAILGAIAHRTGLGDNVMCVYSHTHACPVVDLDRVDQLGGHLLPGYLETIGSAAADAVAEARDGARPAAMVVGQGSCGVAANRDLRDPDGDGFVCGFEPDGEADATVLVARIDGLDGRPIATLMNYACHATTLAWANTLVSPDFPGVARELVESVTRVPCLFLQGASGDIGPREGFVGDPAVAERNGRQLGYAALEALAGLPPAGLAYAYQGAVMSGTRLGVWDYVPLSPSAQADAATWHAARWTIDMAYRPDLADPANLRAARDHWQTVESTARAVGDEGTAQEARARVEQMTRALARRESLPAGDTFPFPVVAWQTGGIRWVAVEAEPYNHLQREIRRRLPDTPVFVLTLMNGGRVAYLPTSDTYGRGIYEEQIAVLAPGSLERLIDEAVDVLGRWQPVDGAGTTGG